MRLVLLASGSGTLAQAIIDANFNINAVITDNPNAKVIERADKANIPVKVIPFISYFNRVHIFMSYFFIYCYLLFTFTESTNVFKYANPRYCDQF